MICLAQQVQGAAAHIIAPPPPPPPLATVIPTLQNLIEDLIGCELKYLNNGKNQG